MSNSSKVSAFEGNIRVLVFQTIISQLGFGMFVVILQPYILSRGFSVVELGIGQSMINLSSALGLMMWGASSDKLGRKPIMLSCGICRVVHWLF